MNTGEPRVIPRFVESSARPDNALTMQHNASRTRKVHLLLLSSRQTVPPQSSTPGGHFRILIPCKLLTLAHTLSLTLMGSFRPLSR